MKLKWSILLASVCVSGLLLSLYHGLPHSYPNSSNKSVIIMEQNHRKSPISEEFDNHCLLTSKDIESVYIPENDQIRDLSLLTLSCLYMRYLTNVQILCNQHIFIGSTGTGGITLCGDINLRPGGNVYFFENALHYFSHTLQQLIVQHGFNISYFYDAHRLSSEHERFNQYHGGLAADANSRTKNRTLSDWMVYLSHKDIEIFVYVVNTQTLPVLEELSRSGAISRIKILILKFYYKTEEYKKEELAQRLVILKNIFLNGFRIYWYDKSINCISNLPKLNHCYTIALMHQTNGIIEHSEMFKLPHIGTLRTMSNMTSTDFYQLYLSTYQYYCHQMIRLGTTGDGGWEICLDKPFRPRDSCLVYSFGINDNWSFDEEIAADMKCQVYSFDPSLDLQNHTHSPGVHFYNIGIGAQDKTIPGSVKGQNGGRRKSTWTLRSLQTILKNFGHLNTIIDVLKMDVEGAEWSSLPQMVASGVLRNVKQLLLEFHSYGDTNKIITLRMLYDEGFRIFWMHRNPFHGCQKIVNFSRRFQCFEVYFVNINFI